jgi:hypothetical protein
MSTRRSSSASPASGSKRSCSPNTLKEAWQRHCKLSTAGSRHAACKYAGALYVREFAAGGRYYKADPPLKPMSGGDFEKWRRDWEQQRAWKAAWQQSTNGGGAPRASEEEEEEEEAEEEDLMYLQEVAASMKDATDKARAEEDEATQEGDGGAGGRRQCDNCHPRRVGRFVEVAIQ